MRGRPWIVALAAVALGGCGGEPALSSGAADDLHAQVDAVREAVADGDRAAALDALDGLQASVRELQDEGALAATDATALRRGIGRARRRVRAEVSEAAAAPTATPMPTQTPTPTPTPTPTAEPAPEEGQEGGEPGTGNDEQMGKGEAKGKGHEKKDKGD